VDNSGLTVDDPVVMVTGASQAAGRGHALAFASAGYNVIVADRLLDQGRETVALAESAGGTAVFAPVDVSDEESTRALASFAVETFGRLDVLVNNAVTYGATTRRSLTELTVEQWDRTMAVFVRGVWLASKAAVPFLAQAPYPSIINQTSVAAYGIENWLDYATARGAVIALTKSMAKELASRRIRVNAIAAGGMTGEATALGVLEEQQAPNYSSLLLSQPIPRPGTAADLAGVALFLASQAAAYMTGQTVVVDGGRYLVG
jgi:NAD(P)-dependent dehydrogenase (short-subunit alcohol dehydrogenase family)